MPPLCMPKAPGSIPGTPAPLKRTLGRRAGASTADNTGGLDGHQCPPDSSVLCLGGAGVMKPWASPRRFLSYNSPQPQLMVVDGSCSPKYFFVCICIPPRSPRSLRWQRYRVLPSRLNPIAALSSNTIAVPLSACRVPIPCDALRLAFAWLYPPGVAARGGEGL